MPVGTLTSAMSSGVMPSRYISMARSVLPCAASMTVSPFFRRVMISASKYGIRRFSTSCRHSVFGAFSTFA